MAQTEKATPPAAEHRRWWRELQLADKREKEWRKNGEKIIGTYRGVGRKRNSFNILAANTETLRPALYSSLPKPDVRRRFRDSDPLGKAVAEVMERCISVSIDHYDFDQCCRYDVLDALLPGRGISRIRYVPSLAQVGTPQVPDEEAEEGSHESQEGVTEEVAYEQVVCEHVDWRDFRRGNGRVWAEVEWIGFRHDLTKRDVAKQFGDEIAEEIKYEDQKDDDEANQKKSDWDEVNSEFFKVAEFWEIWDKEGHRVFFLTEHHKQLIFPVDNPEGEPPLTLEKFYPIPEPIRLFEDSSSLIPTPIYDLYREQADELERISTRINKIIDACKVRGVYDSTMRELADLMAGSDNQMIPASNSAKWQQTGGIEKAIWWMPVDKVAQVLQQLYVARDACKATIYELTGISDIIRGQTNANETLGAQQLKSNYATMRLKKMQQSVQYYIRDLVRLMAEVIGEKFGVETLAKMSGLKFPTEQDKMSIQQQMMLAQQSQVPGQPPNPQMAQMQQTLMLPTWEEIKSVMQDDMGRTFRVDVETDSTVQGILQEDMAALREVLTGIVEFWQGVGPAVQAGAVPIEAVKAITLSIARRSKLGLEVEDSLEKLQAPQQQGDPKQAAQMQAMQQQLEESQKKAGAMELDAKAKEVEFAKRETEFAQRTAAHEIERAQFQAEKTISEKEIALQRDALQNAAERKDLELSRSHDQVAGMLEKATAEGVEVERKAAAVGDAEVRAKSAEALLNNLMQQQGAVLEALAEIAKKVGGSKRVVYDKASGRPVGVEPV